MGNGLVYDSRPMIDSPSMDTLAALPLAVWQSGVLVNETTFSPSDAYNALRNVGFRARKAVVVDATAIDQNGDAHLSFTDASLYLSDDATNLRTEQTISLYFEDDAQSIFGDFKASHPQASVAQTRPLAIELFNVTGPQAMPSKGHSVTWVRDMSPVAWRVVGLLESSDMVAEITNWESDGFRLISLSSRELENGEMENVGLFVKDNIDPSDTGYSILLDPGGVTGDMDSMAPEFVPFYLSCAEVHTLDSPTASFNVLYILAPEGLSVEYAAEMSPEDFGDADTTMRKAGFHLVSSTPYPSRDNQTRWAGIWHRYDNIFRTDATDFDENAYVEEDAVIWTHFDERITELMNGSQSGERVVPSCTFAALDGADVVYQKSYTSAPSIYPDTTHDQVYALALPSPTLAWRPRRLSTTQTQAWTLSPLMSWAGTQTHSPTTMQA